MIELIGIDSVAVGDEIRFVADSRPRNWWRVLARNEEHVVAVRQAAFEAKGVVEYTVTGHLNGTYNGAGPGLVRSSLNTLGGGWDFEGDATAAAEAVLVALEDEHLELSMRRVIGVLQIERKTR